MGLPEPNALDGRLCRTGDQEVLTTNWMWLELERLAERRAQSEMVVHLDAHGALHHPIAPWLSHLRNLSIDDGLEHGAYNSRRIELSGVSILSAGL